MKTEGFQYFFKGEKVFRSCNMLTMSSTPLRFQHQGKKLEALTTEESGLKFVLEAGLFTSITLASCYQQLSHCVDSNDHMKGKKY